MLHKDRVQKREKLTDWLVSILDSGHVPGVRWVGSGRSCFQIPWKHRGKQDWSEDNGLIFKLWAQHMGRANGNSPENYATWKSRLRCALNKSEGIVEVKRLSSSSEESEEPFKVYKFVDLKTMAEMKRKKKKKKKWCTSDIKEVTMRSDDGNAADQFASLKIPTVVQNLDELTDQEEDSPCAESEGEAEVDEPENIIGISLEVLFDDRPIMEESFCRNERVLLRPGCSLYREDPIMPADKMIVIEERPEEGMHETLRLMGEGIHFVYTEDDEIQVTQKARLGIRCEVLCSHPGSEGAPMGEECTIPFDGGRPFASFVLSRGRLKVRLLPVEN